MKDGIKHVLKKDEKYWILPNILTLSRLLFLPPIIWLVAREERFTDFIAVFLMLLSSLTDYLDGYFARIRHQTSHLGRMLDPLVDKINIAVVMIVLAIFKDLPYWFVGLVIGRDLLLLIAAMIVISRGKMVVESNLLGKYTAAIFAAIIILFTLNVQPFGLILMWFAVTLIPISMLLYYLTHRKMIHK